MRILQINSSVNTGSTGRIAEDLGKLIIANGHQSHIAYGRNYNQSISETIKIGNKVDIAIHILKSRLFDQHGFGSPRATRLFINQIELIQPDLIHLHNIHGYYLNVRILINFLKQIDKPVVWTFHDCWPFTGHCSHFQYFDCNKWQTECHNCPNLHGYPNSWFIDNSRQNFRKKKELFAGISNMVLVSPSDWLAGVLRESFFSDSEIRMINNGIDLEKFKPGHNDLILKKYNLDRKFILGVASVWTQRKGLGDFIKLRKVLDPMIDIVLVGLTSEQVKSLPEGIRGLSRTENTDELAVLYSGAEVFVNPTYVDNFPTVNLEALACGTPVITYDAGGSGESINRKTGLVVQKGAIEQMAEGIDRVMDQPRSEYAKACRERAVSLYDKESRYRDYFLLYEELLKQDEQSSAT